MKYDGLKSQTLYSLCASARQSLQRGEPQQRAALPLRVSVAGRSPINHPAIMQRRICFGV